jgi:uncharacterized protein
MLSFEHVRARRDKNQLVLQELSDRQRARAVAIADELLAAARSVVGCARDELERAFAAVELRPSERRLAEGLKKLIEDACEFEQIESADPATLRGVLFVRAAAERRASTLDAPFRRERVLEAFAAESGTSAEAVETALYADLRGAHRMSSAPSFDARTLVSNYERRQLPGAVPEAEVQAAPVPARAAPRRRLSHRDRRSVQPVRGGHEVWSRARADVAGARRL